MDIQEFKALIKEKKYCFFDFGCSKGDCMDWAYTVFDNARPGLGIDISEPKIEIAKKNGHDAIVYDILKIPDEKLVRFVTLSHFLEHLPSVKAANQFLRKAVLVANEFVFIRQPFFDADGYLAQQGLKLYWSDWHGHSNKMTTLDFYLCLNSMKSEGLISGFSINFNNEIISSAHNAIHPLDSAIDQHAYDPSLHPYKNSEIQLENVFKEIRVLVHVDKINWSRFENLKLGKPVITVA